jgi:anaerobic dimethyl sulfoxide reductase subunit A
MNVVPSSCCHDCGGACPLNIYVDNGRITKIEARDVGLPSMRPCARGLLYQDRVYAPDRLRYPMKRDGERGEGKFVRISWDEALEAIAEKITQIRDQYGPAAIFSLPWSGTKGRLHNGSALVTRFLNMAGGHSKHWGGASFQGGVLASLATYGAVFTGNDRADLLNSKMIILWGSNPAESISGTETRWYLTQAREKGIKIVCIDPRYTQSAAAWSRQWIPIRPGTDTALMVAMAFVILKKGLADQHFLDTYTVGFEKYRDYVTGVEDGVAKTPRWAEAITGVPADAIYKLAVDFATLKPVAIIPGWAPGRTARGEQYHRAAATLSSMTGNVGIHGGATACLDADIRVVAPAENHVLEKNLAYSDIPIPPNPVEQGLPPHELAIKGLREMTVDKVSCVKVWDAIQRGKAGGYFTDIKMLYVVAGNPLNQMCDTNNGVRAIRTLDFIVVHDQFVTPTARFADILLPATTFCERNDISLPWSSGYYALYVNKAIEPLYESKTELDIFTELAAKMGITGFNDKTEEEWLRHIAAKHGIPDYDTFKAQGIYRVESPVPYVPFKKQIEDPFHHPFPTPSGKIEIFSQQIADFNHTDSLPPYAKYLAAWEGGDDPQHKEYPLQLITTHSRRRVHSQFHNIPWHRRIEPHVLWMNPLDAKERRITNDDRVKVFNGRGTTIIPAKLSQGIMPGVVCMYQGAWYEPDPQDHDSGGCANILTQGEHSPGGAFCSNSVLVEVEKL